MQGTSHPLQGKRHHVKKVSSLKQKNAGSVVLHCELPGFGVQVHGPQDHHSLVPFQTGHWIANGLVESHSSSSKPAVHWRPKTIRSSGSSRMGLSKMVAGSASCHSVNAKQHLHLRTWSCLLFVAAPFERTCSSQRVGSPSRRLHLNRTMTFESLAAKAWQADP